MRKPNFTPGSDPQPSLPHDHDREKGQPYAKELEDYKHGVASPPEEQVGQDASRKTSKGEAGKRRASP